MCSVIDTAFHRGEYAPCCLCVVTPKRHIMNKYHQTLGRVLASGKAQTDREGSIHHLLNERPTLTPVDLLDIFEGHPITRKKLKNESQLFIQGERSVKKYHEADINWWSCCGSILVSGHPTYLGKLPSLIECTSRERCSSKNYALFLDSTNAESSQVSYLNLVQFQVEQRELVVMTY